MQLVGYIACHVFIISSILIMLQWYLNQNY